MEEGKEEAVAVAGEEKKRRAEHRNMGNAFIAFALMIFPPPMFHILHVSTLVSAVFAQDYSFSFPYSSSYALLCLCLTDIDTRG